METDYSGEKLRIRLDKIANASITWPIENLYEIVAQRLKFFSEGKISSIHEIFENSEKADEKIDNIIETAMRSPRELIRVFDTILRENEEINPSLNKVTWNNTETAMNKYCSEAVKRIFDKDQAQQVVKMKKTIFINKDVQQKFRINNQSAKKRIEGWIDSGMVALTGSRPAEGGAGGKPAYEYSVIDRRIFYIIKNNVQITEEYISD